MSLVDEVKLNWMQTFALNVIKNGPKIRHIAFIMDGNRRYAKSHNIKTLEGHSRGFEKLTEILSWCDTIGIQELTVYAFSIDNFKRNVDEVAGLMMLAGQKFKQILMDIEQLRERGICIRVLGNLSLVPSDLQHIMNTVMERTSDCKSIVLNIAFSYTSRYEITDAFCQISEMVKNGKLDASDVTEELLTEHMSTKWSQNDPDVLIRSSGEFRLSDFLLWQISSCTVLLFTNMLWPLFSFGYFVVAMFYYQCHSQTIDKVKKLIKNRKEKEIGVEN